MGGVLEVVLLVRQLNSLGKGFAWGDWGTGGNYDKEMYLACTWQAIGVHFREVSTL